MSIQVLGRGCGRCEALHFNTLTAVSELGLDRPVEKVYDEAEIRRAGVRNTPALAFDGRVLISGAVPSVKVLRKLLTDAVR
jgi:small redox-active disulfide protein 2